MIPRFIEEVVYCRLQDASKVILIFGARQVGKTTLLNSLKLRLQQDGKNILFLNCDIEEELRAINTTSRARLDRLVANQDAIFIDEAQRLENPGLTLKVLHDLYPHLCTLATGSSSFDLSNRVSDALTGRYLDFILHPLSLAEILAASAVPAALYWTTAEVLSPDLCLYGLYPEIYLENHPANRQLYLGKLVESYLFRDILAFQRIRHSQVIVDLARALAYQIGNPVNESELANRLKIDRKTVSAYLDILEKSFVITRLYPFSRNPRREIGRQAKIYFWDLGIRNALIGDFNNPAIRPDLGAMWENLLIVERLKFFASRGQPVQPYYWRTHQGSEVDYVELTPDGPQGYEIKLEGTTLRRGAETFESFYDRSVQLVNRANFLSFLGIG
jgi:hypothetical protein